MLDGPAVSSITDHPFQVDGEWYERCRVCKLGAAAHTTTAVGLGPDESLPYRCPDCVKLDREVCPHGQR